MKTISISIGGIAMSFLVLANAAFGAGPTTVAYHDSGAALVNKPDAWFATDEGIKAVDAIAAAELPAGGWAKGYDTPSHTPGKAWEGRGTIDNDFTYTELKLLARAHKLTHRDNVLEAFNRGLDFLFNAQYPNGG